MRQRRRVKDKKTFAPVNTVKKTVLSRSFNPHGSIAPIHDGLGDVEMNSVISSEIFVRKL